MDLILVRILGVDRFTRPKVEYRIPNNHSLRDRAHQVHFNPRPLAVVERDMPERRKVEVGTQFTIEPYQQITVKRSGHTRSIVVRSFQHTDIFLQVDAKEKPAARSNQSCNAIEEDIDLRRVEIA